MRRRREQHGLDLHSVTGTIGGTPFTAISIAELADGELLARGGNITTMLLRQADDVAAISRPRRRYHGLGIISVNVTQNMANATV